MNAAPPALPGMPKANSRPVRPFSKANRHRRFMLTPAPQVITPSCSCSIESPGTRHSTTPRSPSSATSTLLPLPKTNGGSPCALQHCKICANCSSPWGSTSRSAGPPVRKEVYSFMGALRFAGQPRSVASASTVSSPFMQFSYLSEFASPRPMAAGRRMRFDISAFSRPQHSWAGQALNLIYHEPTWSSWPNLQRQ